MSFHVARFFDAKHVIKSLGFFQKVKSMPWNYKLSANITTTTTTTTNNNNNNDNNYYYYYLTNY